MNVSIVITCVDMLELTRGCVELIEEHTPQAYDLIIVADECQEEMLDWLKTLEAKVITNTKRVGSPTALNMGINVAEGKYIGWVHNDISVTEGWLEPLITALDEHPDFGWVTSRYMRGGLMANFGIACSFFLKEALDKVGLLDERFSKGWGWDDNDLLLRFWKAGYQPHGVSKSVVYHPAQATTMRALLGNRMEGLVLKNQQLFIEKWGPGVMNIDWINIPYL